MEHWTQFNPSKNSYALTRRGILLCQITERISDFETEMEISESERWTTNEGELKYTPYIYELTQHLGELESEIQRYRQRKKIRDKIKAAMNKR